MKNNIARNILSLLAPVVIIGGVVATDLIRDRIYEPVDVVNSEFRIDRYYINNDLRGLNIYEVVDSNELPYRRYNRIVDADKVIYRSLEEGEKPSAVVERNLNGRYRATIFSENEGKNLLMSKGSRGTSFAKHQ